LASKLKQITFELRKTENEHMSKVQELHGNQHTSDEQIFALDTEEEVKI
jgi:hypothetical protein